MKVNIYTDGASRNNPGDAGIGVVIKQGEKTLVGVGEYIGKTTNNVAEYLAFIRGLEEALLLGATEALCLADSELLVKQLNGEYRVKNEGLVPLANHAKTLLRKFRKISIKHVLREKNREADLLANQGIDEHYKKDAPLFNQ